ncbi:MAG: Minf_1886 family protein [Gemmatimonadota bacterium]
MTGLHFADDVLARIRASESHYDERAYLFVLAGIEYLQTKQRVRRHVTGAEVAVACREFAIDQYGLMANAVLGHWGLTRTADIGRIVFTLVEIGLLVTQPGDLEEEFRGVYDFEEAFETSYVWQGVRRG